MSSANHLPKVFISYSHQDNNYLNRLLVHLVSLERNGLIDIWSDTKIVPGANWHNEIKEAIEFARAAVLLVSADFLASKFIAENELPPLLEMAKTKGTVILPVILSPCDIESSNLSPFQSVNSSTNPLSKMNRHHREEQWRKVAENIREIISDQNLSLLHGTSLEEVSTLDQQLEVTYNDMQDPLDNQDALKVEIFADRLELSESRQEFHSIPNRYSTGTPIYDSSMFFGREVEMAFLKSNLTGDANTLIVLYGQRRIGKTTTLLQLMQAFAHDDHIPVLIDMQGISYNFNVSNFFYRVALYIARAMQKKKIPVSEPQKAHFNIQPTAAFDAFLDSLDSQISTRKLILLVDEFGKLEELTNEGKLEPAIFEYLRHILQHQRNINFLFAGVARFNELNKGYGSVLFNMGYRYRLSKISSQGAEDLIQIPVKGLIEYEPYAVKKIRQLTGDQPYLIHVICRAIVDYCNDRRKTYVTTNDVNQVLLDVMPIIHFPMEWMWDQISQQERLVLSAIAECEKDEGRWIAPVELEEIFRRYHVKLKREDLRNSLKTLLEADFVESSQTDSEENAYESSRYRIPVGLTRKWLQRDTPLILVAQEWLRQERPLNE